MESIDQNAATLGISIKRTFNWNYFLLRYILEFWLSIEYFCYLFFQSLLNLQPLAISSQTTNSTWKQLNDYHQTSEVALNPMFYAKSAKGGKPV